MTKEIVDIVKSIKAKVNTLLADKATLQKDKEQLQQKLQKAANAAEQQAIEIVKLKQQLSALQLLQTELPEVDKKVLAKNIDKHIAAINKTITLLSE